MVVAEAKPADLVEESPYVEEEEVDSEEIEKAMRLQCSRHWRLKQQKEHMEMKRPLLRPRSPWIILFL